MNQQMINRLRKMQQEMMDAEKRLNETIFTGSAGGGLVKLEVYGSREIKSVNINPEILNPEDKELIEDAIMAALNDAFNQIDDETEEVMAPYKSLTGMF